MCVSDYGDGTRGVTILQKDGKAKCLYRGTPTGIANDQPFLPHDIACDANGHPTRTMLDRDGNFHLNLVTKKDGLEGPNTLGLDKRCYLWVGDSHGIV